MAKLDNRRTERVKLPSTAGLTEDDQAWVEIYTDITVGEAAEISDLKLDDVREGIEILTHLIKDWNFTQDGTPDTEKLAITTENVAHIPKDDYTFLSDFYVNLRAKAEKGLSNDEKKASTDSSTQESDKPKPLPITVNYNS